MATSAAPVTCYLAEAIAETRSLLARLEAIAETHVCESPAEADPAPRRPALTLVGGRAS